MQQNFFGGDTPLIPPTSSALVQNIFTEVDSKQFLFIILLSQVPLPSLPPPMKSKKLYLEFI